MKKCFSLIILVALFLMNFTSCKDNNEPDPEPQPQAATPVKFPKPAGFPPPLIPKDNPLTEEGILLGRMLFYDPILSGDSSMSCSSCHKQENAFATNNQFDDGIHKTHGTRNSMPIFNLAWINYGFFWDGRATSIEKQAIEPVHNPIEMDLAWPEALVRLQRHKDYPERFKKAFGSNKITQDNAAKALAQFLRTIVSAESKFDKNRESFTASEYRGLMLFDSDPEKDLMGNIKSGGSCDHCHGTPGARLLQPMDETSAYQNNGIDSAKTISDFKDIGYAAVKPGVQNYGKFKVPSLRNIELTAPYMHDGRFKTLEEVIDHYNNGGHPSPTIGFNMARVEFKDEGGKLHLSEQDKKDLIAFLKTLTDRNLTTNPAYSNPFK